MANSQEIVQINEITTGLNKLNTEISATSTNYLKLVKTIADGSEVVKNSGISYENLAKAQKETTDNAKQLDALGKKLAETEAKLKEIEDGRLQTVIKNRLEIQKSTKDIQLKVKAQQSEKGSIEQLSAVNAILEKRLRSVNLTTDEGRKKAELLRSAIDKNNVAIKANSSALGAQRINIGNYVSALEGLPGAFGNSISGAAGLGKQLIAISAIPIVAIISGIVLVLAGLYKAFTSTDEGANMFSGALKSVGNVVDVLVDRLWSFFKLLGSIATFDWDGIKKNGSDAFIGIGSAIKDAATEGYNFIQVMDDIEDRESASLIRAAKLRKEISLLTVASKDVNKTNAERIRLAELAMNKSIELNNIEKGFLTERTDAEVRNLASKIRGDKLSIESKANQINEWLKLDDTQLESALRNSEAFKNFYNENEADFKKLQKARSEEINKETELVDETRRLQTSLNSFKKEIADEDKKRKDEAAKKDAEILKKKAEEVDQDKKNNKTVLDDYRKLQAEKLVADKKNADDLTKLQTDKLVKYAENKQTEAEIDQKIADKKKEIAKEVRDAEIELATESVNALFTLADYKLQNQLNQLQIEKDAKLSNETLTQEQRALIEAQYQKKENEIKAKQAKNDKTQAMFNIAINTAVAVSKANPIVPLMILAASAGALQLALVAAQPIPKYAKGTKNSASKGIFGEAGRELMFLKSGETLMANNATYFEGSKFKGAQIVSNPETEKMIKAAEGTGINSRSMTDDRILKGLSSVERAIRNKPVAIFDHENKQIGFGTSKHQTIYLNKLMRK